ncbi:MAG: cytochrome b/b6 domain-containing protein [Gammaproteobacteria bacterium]|nr:cytochrome b/b6 domain-containing protein [Gammaproteobacteria bacterium]
MAIEVQAPTTFWDRRTKLLHFGMALFVTLELFNSLAMQEPEPGSPMTGLGGVMFEIHEWAGMAALAIVLVHWFWSLWGSGRGRCAASVSMGLRGPRANRPGAARPGVAATGYPRT